MWREYIFFHLPNALQFIASVVDILAWARNPVLVIVSVDNPHDITPDVPAEELVISVN